MNNPFGSIPVPTTVSHTTVVVPPQVGVHIPISPVGQAINTTPLVTTSLDGHSHSRMDMIK